MTGDDAVVDDYVERARELLDEIERDLDRVEADGGPRLDAIRAAVDEARERVDEVDELEGRERVDAALNLGLELGEHRETLDELEEAEA